MGTREGYHWHKQAWRPSPAQRRLLDALASSSSTADLAARLLLAPETVKWHVGQLLAETHCANRAELADWWAKEQRRRWLALPLFAGAHLALAGAAVAVAGLVAGVAIVAGRSAAPRAAAPPALTGGCGTTKLQRGAPPRWLNAAAGHNVPQGVPFAIAGNGTAAGFLFGYPLRAGQPESPANKILWVVGTARQGEPLTISLHAQNAATPQLQQSAPADSGPGNIYPAIVNVPSAGCWHVTLQWATGRAELDLFYEAATAAAATGATPSP